LGVKNKIKANIKRYLLVIFKRSISLLQVLEIPTPTFKVKFDITKSVFN